MINLIAQSGKTEEGCISYCIPKNELHDNGDKMTKLWNFAEAERVALDILKLIDHVESPDEYVMDAYDFIGADIGRQDDAV